MILHPQAVAMVQELIKTGRAGPKPFGIDRAIWKIKIAKQVGGER